VRPHRAQQAEEYPDLNVTNSPLCCVLTDAQARKSRLRCRAVDVAKAVPRQSFSAATPIVESLEGTPCYEVVTRLTCVTRASKDRGATAAQTPQDRVSDLNPFGRHGSPALPGTPPPLGVGCPVRERDLPQRPRVRGPRRQSARRYSVRERRARVRPYDGRRRRRSMWSSQRYTCRLCGQARFRGLPSSTGSAPLPNRLHF